MLAKPLLLIDVETTGLHPSSDCIVQISAAVLSRRDLAIEREFSSLVRPHVPVGERARAVHGLTDELLSGAPDIAAVLEQFESFAPKNVILAGHNVGFDVAFLRAGYAYCGRSFEFDYHLLDVWSIAFFVLGAQDVTLDAYNLNSLCALFGIRRDYHHDAQQDVRVTASILRHLYKAAQGADIEVLGQFSLFDETR